MIKKKRTKDGRLRYLASVKIKGSRVYSTCDSMADAQRWVNQARFKRDKNLSFSTEPVTIDRMFTAYETYALQKLRAPNTLRVAKQRFHAYIQPFFRGFDMRNVEVEQLETFLQLCQDGKMLEGGGPLSAATCNRIRSLLSVMFRIAVRKRLFGGAFKTNPFDVIETMTEQRPPIEYWTFEERENFLKSNEEDYFFPLFVIGIETGLRIGELVALHAEQVDRTIHILTVDRQYNEDKKKILRSTKSRKMRHIALTPMVREVLYPLLDRGQVFSRIDGAPLLPNFVRKKVMPEACARAQVKDIGPHGLRHTFSAHYLMRGGKLFDLSNILGHSSTKITEEYYAHFDLEHVHRRMNVISREGNLIQANFGGGVT